MIGVEMIQTSAAGLTPGGALGRRLANCNWDPGALRPFYDKRDRRCITLADGRTLATNATTLLRKDQWLEIDQAVLEVARTKLRAVNDLRGAGMQFVLKNGLGRTVLQSELQSGISGARVAMDPTVRSDRDRPAYEPVYLPLPIVFKDFSFNIRDMSISRNSPGDPIDVATAALATEEVATEIEKICIGVSTQADLFTFGGGTIYGLTDHPDINTKTLTAPDGTNSATTVSEVLAMKKQLTDKNMDGPYFCYVAPSWDPYLDNDHYIANTGLAGKTLRDRIAQIDDIDRPTTLNHLTTKTMLLVRKSAAHTRVVVGLDFVTVQWEEMGGLVNEWKIMAIIVPQIRSDYDDNLGIVKGTHT